MSGTEHCPNCQKKGTHDISHLENGSEYDTWQCVNDNCRVGRYYVEPEADR